ALAEQPLDEVALLAIAREYEVVADAALHQAAAAGQLQPSLGLLGAVTVDARALEDGQQLPGEVDRLGKLLGRLLRRLGRRGPPCHTAAQHREPEQDTQRKRSRRSGSE